MLDAGVPLAKIAKIVGWSQSTMVQMSARYGHFTLDELRCAVNSISRIATAQMAPPVHVSPDQTKQERPA